VVDSLKLDDSVPEEEEEPVLLELEMGSSSALP
jgi:hypothetical protein